MTNLNNLTKEELINIIKEQEATISTQQDLAQHNRMVNFGKISMLEREIEELTRGCKNEEG